MSKVLLPIENKPLPFLLDMPSVSGVSDMDYPLQGSGLLSVPNLPELNAVRRVPLPPELVEQFSRILSVIPNDAARMLVDQPRGIIQPFPL